MPTPSWWRSPIATSKAIKIAHAAGVPIALGTDIFASGTGGRHGPGVDERAGARAPRRRPGLTPLEAIEAGTANGPPTLGPQAPRSGVLELGHDADLIGVGSNPLDDVSVLADPVNVSHVWKAGRLVKVIAAGLTPVTVAMPEATGPPAGYHSVTPRMVVADLARRGRVSARRLRGDR